MHTTARHAAARPHHSTLAGAIARALHASRRPSTKKHPAPTLLLVATALFAGVAAVPAQAQNWTGAVSDDWFTAGNWDNNQVPDGIQISINTDDPNPTVIADGDAVVQSFSIATGPGLEGSLSIVDGGTLSSGAAGIGSLSGQGSLTVSGVGSNWTASNVVQFGGNAGTGTLSVLDGGAVVVDVGVNHAVTLGSTDGGIGNALVSGTDSSLTTLGGLALGSFGGGIGTLEIADGGAVGASTAMLGESAGAQGRIIVGSSGSSLTVSNELTIGGAGTGTLALLDGGSAQAGAVTLGQDAGSQGELEAGGAGSVLTHTGSRGEFFVGQNGSGTLTITAGGTVESNNGSAILGAGTGSGEATVTGTGALWRVADALIVGANGSGTLSVGGGGRVEAGRLDVGDNPGGTGIVTVDGDGSVVQLQGLGVGTGGSGSLEITGGARVEAALGASVGSGGAGADNSAITVTGPGSVLDAGGISYVGFNIATGGRVDVLGGGVVNAAETSIGHTQDAQGAVSVSGAGSRWQNSGLLTVGNNASGVLAIGEQGVVGSGEGRLGETALGQGAATVDGPGSAWNVGGNLFVGVDGGGTLDITAGGAVVTGNQGVLGFATGSAGTVTVTGPGSVWTLDDALQVGRMGTGELVIADGGTVSVDAPPSTNFRIIGARQGSTGTVTVTGAGSAWNGNGILLLADGGTGTLTIEAGGLVSSSVGVIGDSAGGTGAAIVSGAGSSWTNSDVLTVGNAGIGMLTVAGGGAVSSTGAVTIANDAGATGTLNIGAGAGEAAAVVGTFEAPSIDFGVGTGTINFNHTANDYVFGAAIGGNGTLNQLAGTTILTGAGDAGGTANVNGGTLLVEGSLGDTTMTVFDGATLGGSGTIGGDVTVLDGATLAPGSSAGTLTLGSLTLSAGSLLDYELGQAGVIGGGVNDLIEIGGNLVLDGTLDITDIGGFGAGVYRLMNYGGALTDNVLELGELPADVDSGDLFVQTAIGGQVNLINSVGAVLNFWDGGEPSLHDDGAIAGGDGVWDSSNRNWTEADGVPNGQWNQDFAVFGGTGGTVTVEGEQVFTGMQFMTDGYQLVAGTGGALRADTTETIIRVDPNVTASIDVAIGGSGGLVKTETGTLVLSASNTYGGGTAIDRGTLQVSSDANLGAAAGALAFDGGTLRNTAAFTSARAVTLEAGGGTFQTDTALTLGGTIAGTGKLTKTGINALVLTGANSYSGGTSIETGEIVATVTGALGSGAVRLNAAALSFTGNASAGALVIDGVLSGITFRDDSTAGSATLSGEGGGVSFAGNATAGSASITNAVNNTLDFFDNASAGNAIIDSVSGVVRFHGEHSAEAATIRNGVSSSVDVSDLTAAGIAVGSLSGAGLVELGSKTLTLGDLGRDDAIGGVISGAGALVKRGAGTLTLTADNTYGGGTMIAAGTLRIGDGGTSGSVVGDAAIAADGTLAFDRSDSFAFAGMFSGDGAIDKLGAGTLALSGDSGTFAGTMTVDAGGLRLDDAALGGQLTLLTGTTLSGTGTLGSVDNAGTVAPGASIGTLALTGDYVHRAGATLQAEIEPGGSSDLLDVAGSATLEGGTVDVLKAPGQYAGETRYTLIDAAGGVTGTFATLDQDLPFLDLVLAYDANHAYLDVIRNETMFVTVCRSFNQCQVAVDIDTISDGGPPPSDDLATVIEELTTLDVDGALAGFDRLSGEAHASFAGVMLEGHALYGQTVSRRLAERREAVGAQQLQGGVWARAYGMASELDGDGNAHGAEVDLHGAAFGVDAWGTEHWLIGASFNAMRVDADFRPGDGGEADAKNVALYTSVHGERAYLDGVVSFAWWDSEVQRRIEVGSIHRNAASEYDSNRLALYLEGGWNIELGGSRLQPLISVERSQVDTQNFRESGAQDLDLIGRSQSTTRTTVTAGLRWTGGFARGEWTLQPTAQLRWLHSTGDLQPEFEVAFAGAPDTGYRVRGVSWPEDRGLVGIGLNARHGDRLDLFVDYDYQRGGGLEAHNLSAGLRYRW